MVLLKDIHQLQYFNNSREQLAQAFYYAYSTGSVYKGTGIAIMFRYGADGTGGGYTIARNSKYGR